MTFDQKLAAARAGQNSLYARVNRLVSAERGVIDAAKALESIDGSHLEPGEPLRRVLDAVRALREAESHV